jgi:hypothetical protein
VKFKYIDVFLPSDFMLQTHCADFCFYETKEKALKWIGA